ncbi:MAG: BLUF domain-containing protein [Pseudomonadota bacterium]
MSEVSGSLTQLVYASQPFGFDEGMLRQILGTARKNNLRDDITGSLICRDDLFLQLLEGPTVKVSEAFGRILRDDRHVDVTELVKAPTTARIFPDWAMRHDPAKSWMWSPDEIRGGAIDRAKQDDVIGIFQRIARETADTVQANPLDGQSCPHSKTHTN